MTATLMMPPLTFFLLPGVLVAGVFAEGLLVAAAFDADAFRSATAFWSATALPEGLDAADANRELFDAVRFDSSASRAARSERRETMSLLAVGFGVCGVFEALSSEPGIPNGAKV
jgi:hypothetical protein